MLIVFSAEFLWDQAFEVWNTRAGMLHIVSISKSTLSFPDKPAHVAKWLIFHFIDYET